MLLEESTNGHRTSTPTLKDTKLNKNKNEVDFVSSFQCLWLNSDKWLLNKHEIWQLNTFKRNMLGQEKKQQKEHLKKMAATSLCSSIS